MMNKSSLNEYLKHNRAVDIGNETQDIIVSDWKDFLEFLYSNGYYVEYILWWERLLLSKRGLGKLTLGGGGPIDTIDPCYYYGETMLEKEFYPTNSIIDIERYIKTTMSAHKPHILVPSFTVKKVGRMKTLDGELFG